MSNGLNAFALSINGVPDDFKGVTRIETGNGGYPENTYFGPIYFDEFHDSGLTDKKMDIAVSTRNTNGFVFESPNFDDYFINVPGLSGSLELELFEYANLHSEVLEPDWHNVTVSTNNGKFTKKPQFRYSGDYTESVLIPDCAPGSDNFTTPGDLASCSFNGAVNSEGVPQTATRTVYFTNTQINDHYNPSGDEIPYFVDCYEIASADRIDSTKCDPDGIGAFQVHADDGMIYHFSLPVYVKELVNHTLKAEDETYALNEDLINNDPSSFSNYHYLFSNNQERFMRQDHLYATSWKLTAITGSNYSDTNADNKVDDGDKGYCIGLNYEKLSSDFKNRAPYYGFSLSEGYDAYDGSKNHVNGDKVEYLTSCSYSTAEVYYIKSISTVKETLYFIKDLRLDGKSSKDDGRYMPTLKLSRIIKVSNSHSEQDLFPDLGVDFNTSIFSTTLLSNDFDGLSILNEPTFQGNKAFIQSVLRNEIVFDHNHSLCKKEHSNLFSSFTNTVYDIGDHTVGNTTMDLGEFEFFDEDSFSSTELSSSGKLTLTKVRVLGRKGKAIHPPYLFDYYSEIDSDQLDFDHLKKDHHGFYKSDFDPVYKSGYITSNSAPYVHAWSLKDVTYPMGSTLTFNYESDKYSQNASNPPIEYKGDTIETGVRRVFRIKSTDRADIEFFDKDIAHFIGDDFKSIDWKYTLNCNHRDLPVYFSYDYDPSLVALTSLHDSQFQEIDNKVGMRFSETGIGLPASGSFWNSCAVYSTSGGLYGYAKINLGSAYGGGIRVKEIVLQDGETNSEMKAAFTYNKGVISSEPHKYEISNTYVVSHKDLRDMQSTPPHVGYSKTLVDLIGTEGRKKVQLESNFNNHFDYQSIIGHKRVTTHQANTNDYLKVRNLQAIGFSGLVTSQIIRNATGKIVSRKDYKYAPIKTIGFDVNEGPYQIGQLFYKSTDETFSDGYSFYERTMYKDIKVYPKLLDVKTRNYGEEAIDTEATNKIPFSGLPKKTEVDYELGQQYTTLVEYAHESISALGPRCVDINNENKAHLVAKSETFSENSTLLSGTTTSWDNTNLQLNYQNGSVGSVISPVEYHAKKTQEFTGQQPESNWTITGHTTLVGPEDKILESVDVDGYYSSVKLNGKASNVLAEASNANYFEFTHSGFETINEYSEDTSQDYFEGDVTGIASQRVNFSGILDDAGFSVRAHTGQKFAQVDPSATDVPSFKMRYSLDNNGNIDIQHGLIAGKIYRASIWMNKRANTSAYLKADLTGSHTLSVQKSVSDASNLQGLKWTKVELIIQIPEDYVASGNNDGLRIYVDNQGTTPIYVDDFRVQPLLSSVTAYFYDDFGNLQFQLDNDNMFTERLYDDTFLNYRTRVETPDGTRKIQETKINYKRDLD